MDNGPFQVTISPHRTHEDVTDAVETRTFPLRVQASVPSIILKSEMKSMEDNMVYTLQVDDNLPVFGDA